MLGEISSCVDEACIAKGENAVYEGLSDQHYGKHAKKKKIRDICLAAKWS